MKTWFHGKGWRETKSWSCPYCKNFFTCGMDLMVDRSTVEHLNACPKYQTGVLQMFQDASRRQELKDLVWKIYQDPHKVLRALGVLKQMLKEIEGI